MGARGRIAFAMATVVLATGSAALRAGDARGTDERRLPTVEQVLDAWRQREARARRFYAEWIHERTYTRFWANCHVPFARDEYVTLRFERSRLILEGERLRFDAGVTDSSGEVLQAAVTTPIVEYGKGAHNDALRVFRDDRIRYDGGRPHVDPRDPPATGWPRNLRPFTTLFDGRRNLQFLPADHGSFAEAYWLAGAENRFRRSLHYLPLLLTVRPSWLEVAPESCRIELPADPPAASNCCVLVDESGLRREFWLDVDRDFVIVSYREDCDVLGARMKNRIDVSYSGCGDGEWLPAAWTTVFFDNHGLMEQYAPATVLRASTDADVGDDQFAVALPAGTWVYDEELQVHHIVGPDAAPRPVTAQELEQGLSHGELIARNAWSGRAIDTARLAWRRGWLRFAVFCVLFGLISVVLQRRRGAKVTP